MIEVLYRASSGNTYNLKMKRKMRLKTANFHKYGWTRDVSARRYGEILNRFTKDPQIYAATLMFVSGYEANREAIDELHADFERDIINQTPGRLIWGDCYIDCYAISSSTEPDANGLWAKNDVEFYCPYPFWIQEKSVSILPLDEEEEADSTVKNYAPGYAYSYSYGARSIKVVTTLDYFGRSDFRMVAYGPFADLYVDIGGNVYNVNYPVAAGEYMVVDSRQSGLYKGQAYVVRANGEYINVFDYRNPLYSLFAKVPPGTISIMYPRTYGIDLTFFMERSEPIGGGSDDYAAILAQDGAAITAKMGD